MCACAYVVCFHAGLQAQTLSKAEMARKAHQIVAAATLLTLHLRVGKSKDVMGAAVHLLRGARAWAAGAASVLVAVSAVSFESCIYYKWFFVCVFVCLFV